MTSSPPPTPPGDGSQRPTEAIAASSDTNKVVPAASDEAAGSPSGAVSWPPSADWNWEPEPSAVASRQDERGHALRVGHRLAGRFDLVRFLAHGGMGDVWEARDNELGGEPVAIKTIRPGLAGDSWALPSFRREIQLAKRVSHPNVCRVHELFIHQPDNPAHRGGPPCGVLFLGMELLRGETLASHIARHGPLPPERALEVLRDLAAGLAAAHDREVVHGDFKTANVMLVSRSDGSERAVITDFGLARVASSSSGEVTARVAPGNVLGTPAYLAPEQVRGERPTPAADLYALGLVACEMLTGRLPFEAETPLGVAIKRLTDPPTRPTQLRAELSLAWERAILACLASDPAQRPVSPLEVVRLAEGNDPGATSRLEPVALPSGPKRFAVRRLAAAGLFVAALAALGWIGHQVLRSPPGSVTTARPVRRPGLVVVPFRNQRPDPQSDWIGTAVSEALASELARASDQLRLLPGDQLALLDDTLRADRAFDTTSIANLQRQLGSELLIAGSYTVHGGTVRLDARLYDQRRGIADVVPFGGDAAAEELFGVVGKLAAQMRQHLGVGGADLPAAGFPRRDAAARAYAEGIARMRAFDPAGALPPLEQAIAEDGDAPLPQLALGRALLALGYEARAREAVAAARARSEDLESGQRLALEALSAELAADWSAAVEARRAGYRLYADDPEPGLDLLQTLTEAGRPVEAEQVLAELRTRTLGPQLAARLELAEAELARARADFPRQRARAQRAIAAGGQLASRTLAARGELLLAQASRQLGELDAAVTAAQRSAEAYEALGDRAGACRAAVELGLAALQQGDLAAAERIFAVAGSSFRELGDQRGVETIETDLGLVAWARRDLAAARQRFAAASSIAREVGSPRRLAGALSNLGMVARAEGELDEAANIHREALALRRRIGDRQGEAISLNNLARVLEDRGELAVAANHYAEALLGFETLGDRRSAADTMLNLAILERYRGALDASRRHLERALELKREVGDRPGEAQVIASLASTALAAGELADADRWFSAAADAEQALGRAASVVRARLGQLEVTLARGDAATVLDGVAGLSYHQGTTLALRVALLAANAALDTGDLVRARQAVREAREAAGDEAPWALAPELEALEARVAAQPDAGPLLDRADRLAAAGQQLGALLLRLTAAEIEMATAPDRARERAAGVRDEARRLGAGALAERAARLLAAHR